MKRLLLLWVLIWLLMGCAIDDPVGFTQRAQIRAEAATDQERLRQQAIIVQAEQNRLAREAEAQALVDVEATKQAGANRRAVTWAFVFPIMLVIIGGSVVAWTVVNWGGRIQMEKVRLAYTPTERQVGRTEYQMLRDYARRNGADLMFVKGRPVLLLADGRKMIVERKSGHPSIQGPG